MDSDHLRTLAAVLDEGSFDAAAAVLGITPSAVSQRIRALESAVGQVVVRRTIPTTATRAGEVLLRQARQRALLDEELWAELGVGERGGRVPLTLAVNADSLDTWFGQVLARAAAWDDVTVRVRVDDQDHTRELLRAGAVLAGITADPAAVAGCRSVPLGVMRYLPAAAPHLRDAHRVKGRLNWSTMPVVRFNAKDDLQQLHVEALGHELGPVHEVPSPTAFLEAIRSGLGWGLVPELQLEAARRGELVRLGRGHEDVALHWQAWHVDSTTLTRLGDAVRDVARSALRQ